MLMNYYLLLGLQTNADRSQIKAAYRRKAKRFHPDTNQGSEAATELFRQLHEAYRVLSNPELRKSYDLKLAGEEQNAHRQRAAEQKKAPRTRPDPRQKFNRFLNSLLDAIFDSADTHTTTVPTDEPAPPRGKPAAKTRRKPDFNFYYSLALEKNKPQYSCGEDGIYRRTANKAQPGGGERRAAGRVPSSGLLILLFSSLWSLLFP